MSSEEFKRGMVAGAKPLKEKFEEFKDEYIKINQVTQSNQKQTNQMMIDFIDSLNDFERKRLLGLSTNNVLESFDENERSILVNGLYTLMSWEGHSSENQRIYFNNLRKSLNVDNYDKLIDFSIIENYFKDIEKHKEYLTILLEFGYLYQNNYEFLQNNNYLVILNQLIYSKNEIEKIKETVQERYLTLGSDLFCNRFLDHYSTQLQNKKEEPQKSDFENMKEIIDNEIENICDKKCIIKDMETIKKIAFECGHPALNKVLACIHINTNKVHVNKIKIINEISINQKENVYIILTTMGMYYKNKKDFHYIKYTNIKDREYNRINDEETLKIEYQNNLTNKLVNVTISHELLFENKLNSLLSKLYDYSIENTCQNLDDQIYEIVEYDKDVKLNFVKLMCNYLNEFHLNYVYIMFVLDEFNMLGDDLFKEFKQYTLSNTNSKESLIEKIKELIKNHDDNSYYSVFAAYLQMCVFIAYLEDGTLKNEKFDYVYKMGNQFGFDESMMSAILNYSPLLLKIANGEISQKDYKAVAKQLDQVLEKTYLSLSTLIGYKEDDFLDKLQEKLYLNPNMGIHAATAVVLPLCGLFATISKFLELNHMNSLARKFELIKEENVRSAILEFYLNQTRNYINQMTWRYGVYVAPFEDKDYIKLSYIRNHFKKNIPSNQQGVFNEAKSFVEVNKKKIDKSVMRQLNKFKKK